jgi:eukaryotic-like serine/threonine-protein kinase
MNVFTPERGRCMIGSQIAQYTILAELGRGGMGIVCKAHDSRLDRDVALKFLSPQFASSENDRARFIQEARAASALTHPNICTIYDVTEVEIPGQPGNQLVIVMELVEGKNLRELIGTIQQKQALEIAVQIADGLGAAHEKGIVHRDIKPENIIVRKDGRVQIMDFGLAKLRGNVSRLTREGSTVGTAGYMSPEQLQGFDTDHRSDIFSFGVVLYELLAGKPPFTAVHESALVYEVVNVDPQPVTVFRPDIEPSIDGIVLECLAKEPSERPQSMAEVAKDLRRVRRESTRQHASRVMSAQRPIPGIPDSHPQSHSLRPRWRPIAIVCAAALLLLAGEWYLLRGRADNGRAVKLAIPMLPGQKLNIAIQKALAISPDGSAIVYSASGKLFLRKINFFTSSEIPGTSEGFSPFFSPDGRWVGFFAGGKLKKVLLEGGTPIDVVDVRDARGGCWSSDGKIIFAADAIGGLSWVPEGGGTARPVTTPDSSRNERTHRWPFALPDGKTVLFTVGTFESPDYYEESAINAVDLSTGQRKELVRGASSAYAVPGYLLYTHAGVLMAVPFDEKRVEITGAASTAVENIAGEASTAAMDCAFSAAGAMVYVPGRVGVGNRALAIVDLAGNRTVLPAPVKSYLEPRIAPDGNRVALTIQEGKDYDIWVYDIGRNTLTRLTFGGTNRSAVWSPDGKRIAWWSGKDGKPEILTRAADGTGESSVLMSSTGRLYLDAWTHDGSTLILDHTINGSEANVESIPLVGEKKLHPLVATSYDEWMAAVSPDGRWLAYASNQSGLYEVYLQQYPSLSGKWQVSIEGGYQPKWAPDSKTLYYYFNGNVYTATLSGTDPVTISAPQKILTNFDAVLMDSGLNVDLFPDGKKFILTIAPDGESALQQINVILNWETELSHLFDGSK